MKSEYIIADLPEVFGELTVTQRDEIRQYIQLAMVAHHECKMAQQEAQSLKDEAIRLKKRLEDDPGIQKRMVTEAKAEEKVLRQLVYDLQDALLTIEEQLDKLRESLYE